MISSLKIREIEVIVHESKKFVDELIYLSDIKDEISMLARIRREFHLIDDFKVKILIDNDIIDSERMNISIHNKKTHICKNHQSKIR